MYVRALWISLTSFDECNSGPRRRDEAYMSSIVLHFVSYEANRYQVGIEEAYLVIGVDRMYTLLNHDSLYIPQSVSVDHLIISPIIHTRSTVIIIVAS